MINIFVALSISTSNTSTTVEVRASKGMDNTSLSHETTSLLRYFVGFYFLSHGKNAGFFLIKYGFKILHRNDRS